MPNDHRRRNEHGGLKLDQVRRLKGPEPENARLRKAVSDLTLDRPILQESLRGRGPFRKRSGGAFQARTTRPERRREAVREVRAGLGVSERRACRVLVQPRSTRRRPLRTAEDGEEDRETLRWSVSPTNRLSAEIVALAVQYARHGHRRITALLRQAGRAVNAKRPERRREGVRRERATGPGAAPNGAGKTARKGPAPAR